ncbi:tRNA synthetases class I (C) catalytic domain-containing protein [Hysterangium stoloniferum]|nr:tRNA synthetases class I (C) catalytic domain-containing protein [Hysterangium stoloniferum]
MSSKQQLPEWLPPVNTIEEPVLKVYNSLTRTKTPFVPRAGRHIKWYNCGPTVYDASHMGHARGYVTQDFLRRILSDYFGYEVHFVMNITDIDDKIIQRSRRNHLLEQLISRTTSLTPALVEQVRKSWTSYFTTQFAKGLPENKRPQAGQEDQVWEEIVRLADEDPAWRAACTAKEEKFGMHLAALRKAHDALKIASALASSDLSPADSRTAAYSLIDSSRDILALSLDAEYGHSITDPSIPRDHAAYWEAEFMKDMKRLRVLPPDTLTRVTEYVEEIVEFIKKLVDRGFAYELDGSVYFDTRAFDDAKSLKADDEEWKHTYLKLEPWSKGNRALLQEGEGMLWSSSRYDADFALWKASKPGEPSWPSVWGPGRPGWHIECSVMATEVFGETMDIHSGGRDLAFPHHDNEIAQSEAYHDCRQWVNYFLHTGHLNIEGLKMSKSLKNFITIDEILQRYTARQLRLAFLLALWNSKIDFQESTMKGEVRTLEMTFDNFFTNVKALIAQAATDKNYRSSYKIPERELANQLALSQAVFRAALCDSFNTPQALDILLKLVSRTNVYIAQTSVKANVSVLESVARWVGKMLRMFGLGEGSVTEGTIGWGETLPEGQNASVDREEILMPYLRTFSTFRDNVRSLAMSQAPPKQVLEFCDRFRDVDLVPLGVALDDQEDGRALVKLVPAATLIRLRDEKIAAAEAKAAKKAAAVAAEREKKLAKLEKGKTPPGEMYKPPYTEQGVYGSWDEHGIPLTDGQGAEINKSRRKKLTKEWELQQKLHGEWVAWQMEEGNNA